MKIRMESSLQILKCFKILTDINIILLIKLTISGI